MSGYTLYGVMDGDVMVYVGIAHSFRYRQNKHFHDAADSRHAWRPLYQLMTQRQAEDRPLCFVELQTFPDRRSALIAERDMIAKLSIVEDGGSLLNERRSSVPGESAGYVVGVLKRISDASKRANEKPEYRRQLSERARRMAADPAYRVAQSEKLKAAWSDPEYRERATAIQHSDEVQAKRVAEMKRRWADPSFREKMAKRRPKTWTDEERAAHGDKCRATLKRKQEE